VPPTIFFSLSPCMHGIWKIRKPRCLPQRWSLMPGEVMRKSGSSASLLMICLAAEKVYCKDRGVGICPTLKKCLDRHMAMPMRGNAMQCNVYCGAVRLVFLECKFFLSRHMSGLPFGAGGLCVNDVAAAVADDVHMYCIHVH
jgi:hypothetical protein